jgi:hypothetical protein
MKDNEKNPDKQEILNKLFTNWQNDKGSLGKTFDYYKGVDKPDIEKMIEKVKLEPDKYTMINGKWVDKTTGVPMSDYAKTYQGAILSDPNYEAYVKHNEFLGRSGYDMSDPNNPMFLPGTEFQGQKYTDQQFDALKKAYPTRVKEIESAAKPALIPNPNSGWFGQGLIAEAKAYNQVEKEINPVWKEEQGLAMERAKLAETARSNRAREAQQRASLEFRKQVSGVADANVVSVVDNINSSVMMNNERSREYSRLFANDYGIPLSEADLARFNKGGASNVINEKIKNSTLDEKSKNNLLYKYNKNQNELIKQNILATNENYTNLFGKEKANQITKSLTNIIKNGESAIANKPIIYEGIRYEKGLQDPKLLAKLGFSDSNSEKIMNEGFFGNKADNDYIPFNENPTTDINNSFKDNFTINSEKISRKGSDEDGEYTYTQNVKQTINPLSHRAIINNPNKLSEKGGNNYIMMEATSDKGKTITFMIPMEEFHIE